MRQVLLSALLFLPPLAIAQNHSQFENEKNGPHSQCATEWRELDDGFDYRATYCLGDRDDLDVHVFRIDPKYWAFDVAVVDSSSSATSVALDRDASFAMNANFFDASRRPLGIVMSGGDLLRSPRSSSWQSIFLLSESGRARIVTVAQWQRSKKGASIAVQAGPRLVVDGHTNRVHQSYAAERAGVCIQPDGDLLFFATPRNRKFDMYEIAHIARRGEEDGGLACHDAMLFDGGHSVNVYAAGDGKKVTITGDPVPVFIVARRK